MIGQIEVLDKMTQLLPVWKKHSQVPLTLRRLQLIKFLSAFFALGKNSGARPLIHFEPEILDNL